MNRTANRSVNRRLAGKLIPGALAVCVLAASGCRTPWYKQDEKSDIVLTEIVIRSEPTGATIRFDDKRIGVAPITIPLEYDHTIELWARTGNPGAQLREDTGPIGTVLLLPIWLIMSIPQRREEMRRNVYGGNVHRITATFEGGTVVEETITLDGAESVDVTLRR